jgi:hypothetical protein
LSIVVLLAALSAGALASGAQALTGCSDNEPSAIVQYCESIPNADGGSRPPNSSRGGETAAPLAASLPLSTVKAILNSRTHARLLTIPGPYRHISVIGAPRSVSSFDLVRVLILIVVAIGLVLATVAVLRRRHPPAAA